MKKYLDKQQVFFDGQNKLYVLLTDLEALQGFYINVKGKQFDREERNIVSFDDGQLMYLTDEQIKLLNKLQDLPNFPVAKQAALGNVYVNTRKNIYFLPDLNSIDVCQDKSKAIALGWHVDEFGDPVEPTQTIVATQDLRDLEHNEIMFMVALNMVEHAYLEEDADNDDTEHDQVLANNQQDVITENESLTNEKMDVINIHINDTEENKPTVRQKSQARSSKVKSSPKKKRTAKA